MSTPGRLLAASVAVIALAAIVGGSAVLGEYKDVAGTKHDVATPGTPACVYCDVPRDPEGEVLWATDPNTGDGFSGLKPLCFSCHDGTVTAVGEAVFNDERPEHVTVPGLKGQDCDRCHDTHEAASEKFLKLADDANPPRPIGVAVRSDGGLAVSDAENHRVLFLDSEGGRDGFNVPAALTVDGAGNLYVVDTLNGRVVELSPDGTYVAEFGRPGDTAGSLARPKGVAVDGAGRVFVSDGLQAAVQVFDADGRYAGVIGRKDPGDASSGSVFRAPAGLWLSGDTLYVADRIAGLVTLKLSGEPAAGDGQGH